MDFGDQQPAVAELLALQSGVVARRQLTDLGVAPHDLERWVRGRLLTRRLPGVFLDHTGDPTWVQDAWAGCLHYGPDAALADVSALRAANGPGWRRHDDDGPIWIAVDADRRLAEVDRFRVRRTRGLQTRTQWNTSPPRLKVEEAAFDLSDRTADSLDVIALLADLCQARRTTASRLLGTARARPRLARRSWLLSVLDDLAGGTCSALEHGYLTQVERPHALPTPDRQGAGRSTLGPVLRDLDFAPLPLVIELDGRMFHDTAVQHDRDLDRDLDVAVDGRRTVRLGWGQVYRRPCRTAGRIGRLLAAVGWSGAPQPCGAGCALR